MDKEVRARNVQSRTYEERKVSIARAFRTGRKANTIVELTTIIILAQPGRR